MASELVGFNSMARRSYELHFDFEDSDTSDYKGKSPLRVMSRETSHDLRGKPDPP